MAESSLVKKGIYLHPQLMDGSILDCGYALLYLANGFQCPSKCLIVPERRICTGWDRMRRQCIFDYDLILKIKYLISLILAILTARLTIILAIKIILYIRQCVNSKSQPTSSAPTLPKESHSVPPPMETCFQSLHFPA